MMTEEMMDAIEKDLVFLATASSEGIPNVVPIGFARPIDNGSILIADNYMNKTRKNIEENPNVAIVTKDAQKNPYQFKGKAEIVESGKIFDEVVEWAQNVMTKLNPKAAIVVKLTEIYSVQPGPEAGKKVE
ncbi:pyridoxamine 5'-phosphate oxidase-related FMN-binding protein [Methanobacterium sp. MB1]|jgi:predicted pyridoxine 5'-phosphate oxidase superfamily flavin-nucleotide-binding protein|uniref:pyridoxamine 5'-phosphate oxidase family protein n=1 Tax=Methanobacterium sp. TaxID=2164 RepID=UPI0003C96091|nr:pyridoxamine 5'-phosphate oxidase family protein [Methanobacterium sp.]CDG65248.1 pyridoxamine 5'-phosphate oxidase-related FMN-binding protein [Methanobacterium sp. MB1]